VATISIVAYPLLSSMKSSADAGESCLVHSSSSLPAPPHQVQGTGYFESEVETNTATLQLETSRTALLLEIDVTALE
jgi:hypothetical protein